MHRLHYVQRKQKMSLPARMTDRYWTVTEENGQNELRSVQPQPNQTNTKDSQPNHTDIKDANLENRVVSVGVEPGPQIPAIQGPLVPNIEVTRASFDAGTGDQLI